MCNRMHIIDIISTFVQIKDEKWMEDENKLLFKIAQMYYEQDMTQSQISKELNIYRTTISRMLKKIREKGIVNIVINYELVRSYNMEQELKEKFRLEEAIVVPIDETQSKETKLKAIGQACAHFLDGIVQPDDVIGFSWGSTLAAVVEALPPAKKPNTICVPMIGGPAGSLESQYHVNTLVYEASRKWGGESIMIDVPAILDQKEIKQAITASAHFQQIQEIWSKLSIALVGIGSPAISSGSNWLAFYGNTFLEEMKRVHAVGDICSNFFDKYGNVLETEIAERTISIDLDLLKNTRYTIGAAESPEKASAIAGALNGGYLDALVTTEETAKALLTNV